MSIDRPGGLPLLRATPHLGRLFIADGAHRVVLLSFRTWTRRFASDPDIAGAPIELDREPNNMPAAALGFTAAASEKAGYVDDTLRSAPRTTRHRMQPD